MSALPSSCLRRALAALAVVAGTGLLVGGAPGPVGAAELRLQEDPAPSTQPATSVTTATDGDVSTTAAPGDATEAESDAAIEQAQEEADEDLRRVWEVVAALAAVAVGLLVLLVLYVRATNPRRAAARRARLLAERDARRGHDEGDEADDDGTAALGDGDDDDEPDEAIVAAPVPKAVPPKAVPKAVPPRPGPPKPVPVAVPVAAAATAGGPVLSRDPDADPTEAVRVVAGSPPSPPKGPVLPDLGKGGKAGKAGRGGRARPAAARPVSVGPAPQLAPELPATDETVRILGPATASPRAAPAPAPGVGSLGPPSPPGPPPGDGDRLPPRSLVDVPAPSPKRPRRVDAPGKRLGTPDAERVLVRPGQAPVRVPPTAPRPGPSDATGSGDEAPASGRGSAPPDRADPPGRDGAAPDEASGADGETGAGDEAR